MTTIEVTLRMTLESDEARTLTAQQTDEAIQNTEDAIRHRLMGEGFLGNDVLVETYSINSKIVG